MMPTRLKRLFIPAEFALERANPVPSQQEEAKGLVTNVECGGTEKHLATRRTDSNEQRKSRDEQTPTRPTLRGEHLLTDAATHYPPPPPVLFL